MTAAKQRAKLRGLILKELREYPNALWRTPWIIAALFGLLVLGNLLFMDRIQFAGDALLELTGHSTRQEGERGLAILIGDGDGEVRITMPPPAPDRPRSPDAVTTPSITVIADDPAIWAFDRDWDESTLPPRSTSLGSLPAETNGNGGPLRLNALFNGVHAAFLVVLFFVTINYLLGSLFHDRRDGSVLFWRSMPVSALQEVGIRMLVACLVVPAIYIVASWLAQLFVGVGGAAIFIRKDIAPVAALVGNIDWLDLLGTQLLGWLLTAAMISPVYAWCLLASAAAPRAPFLLALTPVIVIAIAENTLFGTHQFLQLLQTHLPHYSGSDDALGFYLFGWREVNVQSIPLLGGLLFALLASLGAAALRRYHSA